VLIDNKLQFVYHPNTDLAPTELFAYCCKKNDILGSNGNCENTIL